MFIDFREKGKGEGRAGGRERNINVRNTDLLVASCTHPNQGSNLQPRRVPWPKTYPATCWGVGWHCSQLSRPARAGCFCLWLLWVMLLHTFTHMSAWEYVCACFFDIYLGTELSGHMEILCLTFWKTTKLFSSVAEPFYLHFYQQCTSGSYFSTSSPILGFFILYYSHSGEWSNSWPFLKFFFFYWF